MAQFCATHQAEGHAGVTLPGPSRDDLCVVLSLPRFSFRSAMRLKEVLGALGMTDAFEGSAADFSGIEPLRELFISEVIHEAFVAVNEEGTEATAATAVVANGSGYPVEPPRVMNVSRPFVFFIRNIETGAVLFLGRVLDPRA